MPRRGLHAVALVLLLGACATTAPTPSTSPSVSGSVPEGAPITVHAYSIQGVGNYLSLARDTFTELRVGRMVHAGVYRFDATLAPVPDLAAEPCDVAGDRVTITCTLRAATFHDGSPVTAADVAFAFRLAASPECTFLVCVTDRLQEVTAVDERTVRFVLAQPHAPFLSANLAEILIESRSGVEAAYDAFAERSRDADPARLAAVAGRIREALEAPEPQCEGELEAAEAALREVGIEPADRTLFVVFLGRGFDACAYAEYLELALGFAERSIGANRVDAIAAAYPLLSFPTSRALPVGAGPWRVREFDPATGMSLARHDAYHLGRPVTPEIRVAIRQAEDEIHAALAVGSLDWLVFLTPGEERALRDVRSIRIARYPSFAYGAIQYNVRPGRVFADRNLRQAVARCIDKERIIEASTVGGVPIYSPIPPGSWAYQPGLARERDVDAGRALIEASGWQEGADGIYERNGRRLSAELIHRADVPPAQATADRVAQQVRDCGIELTARGLAFPDLVRMIETFPHVAPGTVEPFDVYMGGWAMGYDPDATELFHSSRVTSERQSGHPFNNYIGFSHPEVDRLLDEGLRTYDQAERARIYRELQRLLDEEQPYLFLNALPGMEAIDADFTSTAGPLELDSPQWWWQLETLVNPVE